MIEKSYSNGLVEAYEYDASNQLTDITDNYGKHITHEYDGLGNRTGRREEAPYNYSVILPEGVSYDKDELNINEIIDSASDAVSNVIDNKYYCTVSTLEDTTRVVEETYVNDLAQDYAQVLETSGNDEDYESYTYGLTRLSTQSQQGTDYHIINGKFDIIGTVGAMKTSWLSFSLSGKSQAYDTPRFGYSSEAHEGTLQYLRARYYDTETGIFLSKDTYTGTKYNELSQNRYIYTENNPMNRTDPSGNFFSAIGKFVKKGVDWVVNTWNNSTVGQVVNKAVSSVWETVTAPLKVLVHATVFAAEKMINQMKEAVAKSPKPLSPKEIAIQEAEKIMVADSNLQIGEQTAKLREYLTTAGYSEEEIKAKELELIKKYCDRFGLDFASVSDAIAKGKSIVERNRIDSAINELRPKLQNELMRISSEKLSMHEYDEFKKKLVDDYCKEHIFNPDEKSTLYKELSEVGFAKVDAGTLLTGLAIVATAVGLVAFGGFVATALIGKFALASMTTTAATALLTKAGVAGSISTIALATKSIAGYSLNDVDQKLTIVNAVLALGVQIVGIYISVASVYQGKGNPSLQIEGTSYDVNELYKTQPDSFADRSRINSMKDAILADGPDAVPPIPVRVHNGQALIVDGHHRFQAFVELGYDRVPIKYISENQISSQFGRTLQELLNMMFK